MDIPMDGIAPEARGPAASRVTATSARARPSSNPPSPPEIECFPVEFSGSGGTYFRVWIVNVLLTMVTLGFYVPFARRRTAQYFYGHTVLADSPLEFTGRKGRMFAGFLVLMALVLIWQVASTTGQVFVTALLMAAAAVLAPWVWGGAMRFRLGATRWRGVRLQFRATWSEVYAASWPVFAIAATWLVTFVAMRSVARPRAPLQGMGLPGLPQLPGWAWILPVAALAVTVLCLIRLEFNYKSLLVAKAWIGDQSGRWKPVYRDFVHVWAVTVAMFFACLVPAVALTVLVWVVLLPKLVGALGIVALVVVPLLMAVTAGAVVAVALPPALAFREARIFRLVWNNVGVGRMARFRCDLDTRAYVLLRIKNVFLTLVTLGFYRPFALVSQYRMKSESVSIFVKGDLDQLVGQLAQQSGAMGDALADAAGLDLVG